MSVSPTKMSAGSGGLLDELDSPSWESPSRMLTRTPWMNVILLSILISGGAALGWWVAERLELAQTERLIQQSTSRVLARLDDILDEAVLAFESIDSARHDHCSEQALLDMRTQLFEARYLRDIGGIRGYSLFCSTALGILDEPYHSSAPPIRLPNGTGIRTDRSVLASQRLRTVVVEQGSYNALVDSRQVSDLVQGLRKPHIELAVRQSHPSDWHPFSLLTRLDHDVDDERLQARVQCSDTSELCVRIRLGQADGGLNAQHAVIGSLGGALGGSLFLLGAGFKRLRNTPDRALAKAIREHRIRPFYQPIVRLPGGALVGFEALARWTRADGQLVSTELFIQLAESNGMISEISALMIRSIGEDIGSWLADNPSLHLTINVSPEEFCNPSLLDHIETHLLSRGIRAGQIVLEITERTMLETDASQDIIQRMNQMGLRIYADDFGVGYCGLAYLNELDIHGIKISQQLTAAVATESPKASLVPRVTDMARDLNLEVVIEGVETEQQREALRPLEPVLVQGWLFARELDSATIARFHRESRGSRRVRGLST